jgi:hypothetical protein
MKQLEGTIRSLTELLLPVLRQRITELGVDASGAYNFYKTRLDSDRVFSDYEVRLVGELVERLSSVDEIHEIGCGWGQLVFLLVWCGYEAVGFEVDARRFGGGEFLRKFLGEVNQDRVTRAKLRNEYFPPLDRPAGSCSLVISTNIIVSDPHLVEEQIVWALRRYRYAIVDVDRFCRLRRPDERQGLIAMVEQAGLKNAGLFCDAGVDGQYYLFEREAA